MKILMGSSAVPYKTDKDFIEQLTKAYPDIEFYLSLDENHEEREIVTSDVYYGFPSEKVLLAVSEKLKWIHVPGTGIDGITNQEFIDSDVILTNCPQAHTKPMADHVMGMIISLAHKLWEQRDFQKQHVWAREKYQRAGKLNDDPFVDLSETTLGIVSMGGIGRQIAQRAKGFEMEIYGVDKYPSDPPEGVSQIWGLDRLDDLIQISDWLVITSPYTPETKGLINEKHLHLFKPSSHVIVISRGGIFDEKALLKGLQTKKIKGAGIDAFETEPLDPKSPLWDMPNVIISPHTSSNTYTMESQRKQIFVDNLDKFIKGEKLHHICNKKEGF
jgi:phosphoglycerate dehydrogenase-like enzyme